MSGAQPLLSAGNQSQAVPAGGGGVNAPDSGLTSQDMSESEWQKLVESANPTSLIVVIVSRLGPAMRARLEPEDILQESLMQAWQCRGSTRIESRKAFRAWLLTIIDHRIRDAAEHAGAAKRGGGTLPTHLNMLKGIEPGTTSTPSRSASRREQASLMMQALDCVPPESREVVRLRLFQQMTLQDVGQRLGLSLAIVRRHLRQGSELYRQRLREAGIGLTTIGAENRSAQPATNSASMGD